jgi:hypothetical protein
MGNELPYASGKATEATAPRGRRNNICLRFAEAKAMTLGVRLDTHRRVPKSATSDGDKAKGPAVPVAVFGGVLPWQ